MFHFCYNQFVHFFDQLQALRQSRPFPCIVTTRSENCDYAPYHPGGKNCYLIVGHVNSEDCMYGFWVGVSRDCVDCVFTEKSELCYECADMQSCYDCNFCQDCIACSDLNFCYDCKGCQNCFGSVNLRNRQYFIFNKPHTKDEYFQKIAELKKQYRRLDTPPSEFINLKLRFRMSACKAQITKIASATIFLIQKTHFTILTSVNKKTPCTFSTAIMLKIALI